MNFIFTLAIFIAYASAKVANCRPKLKNDDTFVYCSKFSAPANSKVEIELRGRLINLIDTTKPFEDEVIFYEIGVFSDA